MWAWLPVASCSLVPQKKEKEAPATGPLIDRSCLIPSQAMIGAAKHDMTDLSRHGVNLGNSVVRMKIDRNSPIILLPSLVMCCIWNADRFTQPRPFNPASWREWLYPVADICFVMSLALYVRNWLGKPKK